MNIERKRIHVNYLVVSFCMVAQFLIGYDGDRLSYISSGFSATLLLLIAVLVQVKIYSKVELVLFAKEYWIAMGVASILSHAVAYFIITLRGDFFFGLYSFLALGVLHVLSFLVLALLPFLLVVVLLRFVPRSFLSGEST